jgi:hypothetical protein
MFDEEFFRATARLLWVLAIFALIGVGSIVYNLYQWFAV